MRGKSFFWPFLSVLSPAGEKRKEGRGLFFPCLHTSPHSSSVLAEGSDAQEVSFTLKKKSVCACESGAKGSETRLLRLLFFRGISCLTCCSVLSSRRTYGTIFFPCAVRQRGRGRYLFFASAVDVKEILALGLEARMGERGGGVSRGGGGGGGRRLWPPLPSRDKRS